MKRIILEMGTGNDLYGEDYTKAACRAVDDALHRDDDARWHVSVDRQTQRLRLSDSTYVVARE